MLLHRLVRRGGAKLFGKKFLILIVVTDPIPEERVVFERAIRGPEVTRCR